MFKQWQLILIGSLASIALILAACSPASDSEDSEEKTEGAAATTEVQEIKESASGSQQKETTESTAGPSSVSGIPLDPDAKYGGVLQTMTTGEGPSFSTWEEAAGVAPYAMQPLHSLSLIHI